MSVLFCDTNCELWYTRAEDLGLRVIRMPYILDGQEYYYDLGKETDFRMFYDKVRAGVLPTTAALNEFDYIEYFEPVLAEGKDVFYITFSHKLSGTFEFMDKAIATLKEKYPERKITTFDTKSISMGAGITVYYAAQLWKNGATDEELLAFLEDFTSHVGTYFCVDSLAHLQRGGRITGVQKVFGTLLGLKPLIEIMPDGSLKNVGKIKGAKKVITELAGYVRDQGGDFDKYEVTVMQADCESEGNQVADKIREYCGENVRVNVQLVGPVIATHCGPGTLGVIFKRK